MVNKNNNKKQMSKQNKLKEEGKKISVKASVNSANIKDKRVQEANRKNVKRKSADVKSAGVKKVKSPRELFNWTVLIAMAIGIVVFLCKSEMFNICNIEVTGNNHVSQEVILTLSEIQLNKNIFLSRTSKAEQKISTNPYIKEVNVKRILPDKIKIEIVYFA